MCAAETHGGQPPQRVREWAAQRQAHRQARDFAAADGLRDRIDGAGWLVTDAPQGQVLTPKPAFSTMPASSVPDRRDQPDAVDVSVLVLIEGHGLSPTPDWVLADAQRAVRSVLTRTGPQVSFEVVILDDGVGGEAGAWAADMARNPGITAYHLAQPLGFVQARALQQRAARGRILLWLDTGVELVGDVLGDVLAVLDDDSIGAVGRWGADLGHSLWHFDEVPATPGPRDAHAVWGYLLALRREPFCTGAVQLDEGFRFYRNADADVSFRLRAAGWRTVVVGLPAVQHVHRGYTETPKEVEQRESQRNYRRLLDRWRPQMEALLARDD